MLRPLPPACSALDRPLAAPHVACPRSPPRARAERIHKKPSAWRITEFSKGVPFLGDWKLGVRDPKVGPLLACRVVGRKSVLP